MLTSVIIDGFKSLSNFKLNLKPGMNVLVGRNGAGKTNILNGLEFVSQIVQNNLTLVPGNLRLSTPVELFDVATRKREIEVLLTGTDITYCEDIRSGSKHKNQDLEKLIPLRTDYVLGYKVGFDSNYECPLIFLSQTVDLVFKLNLDGTVIQNQLQIESSNDSVDVKEFKVREVSECVCKEIEKIKTDYELSSTQFFYDSLLRSVSNNFYPIINILEHIYFKTAYDIFPSAIRNDGNERIQVGIKSDGSGLASTLLHLTETDPKKSQEIVESIKLVSNDIADLQVKFDKETEKVNATVKLCVDQHGNQIELPMYSLADGMLKWFSLMAAIEFSNKNIVIDEPENFLDTYMQQELSMFIREELEDSNRIGILSTHSETFMNTLAPDEIILVRYRNGSTYADRVKEIDRLTKNMSESGDGLGRFFETETLELFIDDN